MAAIQTAGCGCGPGADTEEATPCSANLPDDPRCAVNYHFGMLLGVDDFRVDQGFHLGHVRRHQRELHGAGVVWGFGVSWDPLNKELKVEPGYAIDRAGRDLVLGVAQCLSLREWWKAHAKDPVLAGRAAFDADVMLCHDVCLSRPVPAVAARCAGAAADIAFSRACETVKLVLVPRPGGAAPPPPPEPYRLLRIYLGLPVSGVPTGDQKKDEEWLGAERAVLDNLVGDDRADAEQVLLGKVIARAAARTTPPAAPSGNDSCEQGLSIATVRNIRVEKNDGEMTLTVDADAVSIDQRPTALPLSLLAEAIFRTKTPAPAKPASPNRLRTVRRSRGDR